MENLTLFGAHISPYVRKTRLVLAFKGLPYEHIPVIPFSPDKPAEFTENSPLGKIPLLKVGSSYIPDSSVICAFLEREVSSPALLPENNLDCARVQWFEEYADGHMTSVIGGHLFAEMVLARIVFKREPDQKDIDAAISKEIPAIFDYLSAQLKGDYLVGNQLTLADIAVCGLFVAMHHCQFNCDANRWPRLANYIDRIMSLPEFAKTVAEEQAIMKSLQASVDQS